MTIPSNTERCAAAQQLLQLERQAANVPLDIAALTKWESLALKVFGEAYGTRRSLRLPTDLPAKLSIAKGIFDCRIRTASQLGCTIASFAYRFAGPGTRVTLTQITLAQGPVELALDLEVVAVYGVEGNGPAVAGLEISQTTPDSSIQKYLKEVHRPIYVQCLERLSEGLDFPQSRP